MIPPPEFTQPRIHHLAGYVKGKSQAICTQDTTNIPAESVLEAPCHQQMNFTFESLREMIRVGISIEEIRARYGKANLDIAASNV